MTALLEARDLSLPGRLFGASIALAAYAASQSENVFCRATASASGHIRGSSGSAAAESADVSQRNAATASRPICFMDNPPAWTSAMVRQWQPF